MRRSRLFLFAWTVLLGISTVGAAASADRPEPPNTLRLEGADPAPARVEQLAWLTGSWRGEGLGGDCEEVWGAPIDGRMYGFFVLRREGEVVFSEAMVLMEEGDSVVLRLKHFTGDFVAWEDKADSVDFRLVKIEERAAYFSGLTFRLEEDGSLTVYLVLSQNGERTEHTFRFRRADELS